MPRVVPHFKVHTSVMNHPKMAAVWSDNRLLAMWLRLGVLAIERYADRTGDTFIVSERELVAIAGTNRSDSARKLLENLVNSCPILAENQGTIWRITFPNFARKQGFGPRKGVETRNPSSSASSSSSTSSKEKKDTALSPPDGADPCVPSATDDQEAPESRAKRGPEPSPEACELAAHLAASVRSLRPEARIPKPLRPWERDLDLMIRRDARDPPAIREAIDWLFGANQLREASFVVLSAGALREKFDKIAVQMQRDGRRRTQAEAQEAEELRKAEESFNVLWGEAK